MAPSDTLVLEPLQGLTHFWNKLSHHTDAICSQILHQLIRLGKVWKDILPVDICCQSLGALVDAVLQHLVEKVLLLEVGWVLF